uniref:Peptidyl-prolyl cis-trans isomerase n=2 Tax=Tetranychus urticae TaxID=32264 RepID=T1K9L7_TETUR
MSVLIETSVGDITIDLLIQERPKCCYNFLKLCKMKFYNFCGFHRLEKDFIAQTGDPTGTGEGGHSVFYFINYENEKSKFFAREVVPKVNHTRLGTVSMVNNGDDMHGSQFFITLREDLDYLDGIHTVFGYVVEGLDTLNRMNELFFSDIIITHTVILEDPFDDPPDLIGKYPDNSPEPSEELISRMCIAHNIDEKPELDPKEQESKAAATILEMIGDLPSEDVKPPDNVLFVCKLNPVTNEEDLSMIFRRFGPIKECEVIRDYKTGDSLQYAFIEFENVKDCEQAYFKMDNVVIDDRRIHVDFSQSVAKFKWKRKSDLQNVHEPRAKRSDEFPRNRGRDEKERNRDRDRDGDRDRDRDRERDRDRDRYRERDRERERDRDRNRNRDRDTDRDRDRGREREREKRRERNDDEDRHSKDHYGEDRPTKYGPRDDRYGNDHHEKDRSGHRSNDKSRKMDYDEDRYQRKDRRDKDREKGERRDESRSRTKSHRH